MLDDDFDDVIADPIYDECATCGHERHAHGEPCGVNTWTHGKFSLLPGTGLRAETCVCERFVSDA